MNTTFKQKNKAFGRGTSKILNSSLSKTETSVKQKNKEAIRNVFNNMEISLKAKGIFSILLTNSYMQTKNITQLNEITKISKYQLSKYIRELENKGCIKTYILKENNLFCGVRREINLNA